MCVNHRQVDMHDGKLITLQCEYKLSPGLFCYRWDLLDDVRLKCGDLCLVNLVFGDIVWTRDQVI